MSPRRLLIYRHDSFGLGHLRRCRSIALSLVARNPKLSVMIISGLPLIARFGFHPQIHITLVPGIIKTDADEYRALSTEHDIHDAIEQRSRIILETAQSFQPNLLLVDKEPLGVRGEVQAALEWAKQHSVPVVENPPVARALYATVEIDHEIPPEHYKAVAEVISYVFRLKGKLKPAVPSARPPHAAAPAPR